MAAFDFPASPSVNDTYTANGVTFIWNGTAWSPFIGDGGIEYTAITLGSVEVLESVVANGGIASGDVKILSATKGVAIWRKSSNLYLQCCVFDISGTTITAGAVVDVASYAVQDQASITIMDSTTVVFTWGKGSPSYCYVRAATVSGTTLTFGSEVEISDSRSTQSNKAVKLTSTTLMVGMSESSTDDFLSVILSVFGTTITDNTLNVHTASYTDIAKMILAESGQVLAMVQLGSFYYCINIAYSGTSISSVENITFYSVMGMSGAYSNTDYRIHDICMIGTDVAFALTSGAVNYEMRFGTLPKDLIFDFGANCVPVSKMIPIEFASYHTLHFAEKDSTTAFFIYNSELKLNAYEIDTTNGRFSSVIESNAFMTTTDPSYTIYNYVYLGSRKFLMFYRDEVTTYPSLVVGSY